MWESHADLGKVVAEAWHSNARGDSVSNVKEKLQVLSGDLGRWERYFFRECEEEISKS